jgi:hypothetical protein
MFITNYFHLPISLIFNTLPTSVQPLIVLRVFLIALFVSVVGENSTKAQILNVERFQSQINDTIPHFTELGFNTNISHIENTLVTITARSFSFYKTRPANLLLLSSLRLIYLDRSSVVSNGYVHLRSTFSPNNRLHPEVFLQYQFDAIRGLNRRELQGSDVRITLVNNKVLSLDISSGFMHEFEWWKKDGLDKRKHFLKSTSSILAALPLSKSFTFHTTGYYQFSFTRLNSPRIIADSRLTWKITQSILLSATNNFFFDAKPIIPIDKIVNETSIELILQF